MALPRTQQNPGAKHPNNAVRLIAIALLALIVLVGLAVLITWLVVKPKKLQYSIDEGWVRDFNLSNGHLNSTVNYVIKAYNPNSKVKVYYDSMRVSVSYRGQTVSQDMIQPFVQPRKNETRLLVQSKARDFPLPGKVVHDLKVDRTGGEVDMDIRIKAKIRFKVGIWKSHHYKMKVLCSPVKFNFSNQKKFHVTDCDVDI